MGDRLPLARQRPNLASAIGAMALLTVAACETGPGGPSGTDATASIARPATVGLQERDVEAPDVFQRDETGLWDGRPSLGGVWVAHPDVGDPERVLIRNAANGQYVIGALFRRERETPGPSFQVSSDAASALGLLAGAPVELQVVALRRKANDPAVSDTAPAEAVTPEADVATPEAEVADSTESAAGTESTDAEADAPASARRGLFSLFGARGANPETAAQEESEATAADASVTVLPSSPAVEARLAEPAPSLPPEDVAEAAPAMSEAPRRGLFRLFAGRSRGEPLSAIAPADAAAVTSVALDAGPATPRASGTAPARSHVQIGIFSVEANARGTATRMRRAGLSPTVHEETSQGKTFWRVTVGPATTEAERAALVTRVREMGFADAYPVAR